MAIRAAASCATFFLAGGIFSGMACRVPVRSASVFLIMDLTVSAAAGYGLGGSFNLALAPDLMSLNLIKLVASKVIGFLVTLSLQQLLLPEKSHKDSDTILALNWKQAIAVQVGAPLALGLFALYSYKSP